MPKAPKPFNYNVVKLIEGVRDRPCLWDKSIENYKDRIERRAAWEEIFNMLDERYEEMSWEEKRVTGEVILNKWTNIRDTFVKSLKTKMGKPKRKYLLYDHLKFMIKVMPEEECPAGYSVDDVSISFMKQEDEGEGESSSYSTRKRHKKVDYNESYVSYDPPKKSKKERDDLKKSRNHSREDTDYEGADNLDFAEVDETDPRIMNEDEAFFASLLPTVVNYSEDERLEFRIEVLAVMKKIRDKRKWTGDDD